MDVSCYNGYVSGNSMCDDGPVGDAGRRAVLDGGLSNRSEDGPAAARGVLIVAGAPIGNAADASLRLASALQSADVVAAEDTRRVRRLAADLGVQIGGQLISNYEAVERSRAEDLVAAVEAGKRVLLISDSGMPTISDPGFRAVRAAVEADLPVTVLPGPSAVTAALAVSGLPTDRFCFEGFLPRKSGERLRACHALATEPRTLVLLESPRRILATLTDLAVALGADRRAALCRELTKTYEEVVRGTLADLVNWASESPARGEITVVVAGADATQPESWDATMLVEAVAALTATGMSRKDAIASVAATVGTRKRIVYQAVLDHAGKRERR